MPTTILAIPPGTCVIEQARVRAGQHQVDSRGKAFKLLHRSRAGNGRRHAGPRDQPCERHGGGCAAVLVGHGVECIEDPRAALVQVLFDPAAARTTLTKIGRRALFP